MYTPHPEDAGDQLLLVTLRDYLATNPDVLALLAEGSASIVAEGHMTVDTPTPLIMPTILGDGDTAESADRSIIRCILWVMDSGRGYARIAQVIAAIRTHLRDAVAAMTYFTYPAGQGFPVVYNIELSGSTASTSFPLWQNEARGVYLQITAKL